MPSDPELLTLALAVLAKNRPQSWDRAWDTHRTTQQKASQSHEHAETPNLEENQSDDPSVPLFQPLGHGTVGQQHNPGTAPGTVVGQQDIRPAQHYVRVLTALQSRSPAHVEIDCWQQALADAEAFLARWGEEAQALGWTARELFGLHTPPEHPSPSYRRLSRYDQTGLVWLLQGRPVVALTVETAAIQTASGGTLIYRKCNKPAFGPVGDSLDDFDGVSSSDMLTTR